MTEPNTTAGPQTLLVSLTAENLLLKQKIAAYEFTETARAEKEKLIAVKVARGLTRDQAIAVIDRQKAADEAAARKAEGGKRKTENGNDRHQGLSPHFNLP